MDSWVRFNAQSQAKERVFRAAQYACMLLGHTLRKSGTALEFIDTVKQLESQLSLMRKLIRLGNSAEALEAAKRAVHLSDSVLRLCLTVAHLNRAMYFACDNILWAGKTGLLPELDQNKWSQRSFRYYLFALILNLTRDAYEISLLMEREVRSNSTSKSCSSSFPPGPLVADESDVPSSSSSPVSPASFSRFPSALIPLLSRRLQQQFRLLVTVLRSNPPLLLDLLKNTCDVFIPLDRLSIYPTGPGFVGACGLVSSCISILTIIHPWLKLKP